MTGQRSLFVVCVAVFVAGGSGLVYGQGKGDDLYEDSDSTDPAPTPADPDADPANPENTPDEPPDADADQPGDGADAQPGDGADAQPGDGAGGKNTMGGGNRPWSKGVSETDRTTANSLFDQGNELLRDSFFVEAVSKYREALSHWDHPAIHYNLALALINLDQPLEVYAALEKALAYNAQALDSQKKELAERYKKLVEQQIARVTVSCDEPDAKVIINGKEAFTCPGAETRLLRSGEHTFTATKPGFESTAKTVLLPGGETKTVVLKLYRLSDLTRYKRRFDTWVPWTVAGAGLALGGIGALLHVSARSDFEDFDDLVRECVAESGVACDLNGGQADRRDRAERKQAIALGMYAVGAVAVVSGVTMVVLNRPRPYRVDRENPGTPDGGLVVAPTVGADGVGVAASLRF